MFRDYKNILGLDCKNNDLTMSGSLFGTSPFQQVPNPLLTPVPQQGTDPGSVHMPSAMPFTTGHTFAYGPSPDVSPTPSRTGSVRHGSAEQESHRDVFGRRSEIQQDLKRLHAVTLE